MSAGTWKMVERGRRWQYFDATGKMRGVVVFVFDMWDAILITGKKWPNSQKSVNFRDRDRRFWAAKRAVEEAVSELLSSPAATVTNPTTELDAARKE